MELTPTPEQIDIINEASNCVVVAKPGSGKTFTLALKIKGILPNLPEHKGVVAISYTNKASDELERRCLSTGINRKSSFFGTIDKFFISEIIIPFGRRIFGNPKQEIDVVKANELQTRQYIYDDKPKDIEFLGNLYRDGKIVLEYIGFCALHIFDQSEACRRYLKSRYTHIIIDEYQDCGEYQHELFIRLVQLGLTGVAVGDIDQSIFKFAGKSSKYLIALAQNTRLFKTYPLSENHRCHKSIINYSTRLLSLVYEPKPVDELCVYSKRIEGSEIELAQWLSTAIPQIAKRFQVEPLNRIAVLVKNNLTANLVHGNLTIPHKHFVATPLDDDSSLWGSVFRKTLAWAFNAGLTKYEIVESYLNVDLQNKAFREAMNVLNEIENLVSNEHDKIAENYLLFEKLAFILFPIGKNRRAAKSLRDILGSPIMLSSFIPPKEAEVQVMTLHKSKGLEFDVVFHLNMYRWILPQYQGDYSQDLNLHYVGITRAKKCCVLCSSTLRHKSETETRTAEDSEFLYLNGLERWRECCPI